MSGEPNGPASPGGGDDPPPNGRKPPPADRRRKDIRDAVENAVPATRGGWRGTDVPGFEMTPGGLFKLVFDKDAKQPKVGPQVSGFFEVLAETRDGDSEGWGLLLRWADRDGKPHEWIMPRSLLAGDGTELRQRLASGGLFVAPNPAARAALVEFLAQQTPRNRVRTVPRVGWHFAPDGSGAVFVLPAGTVGELPRETVRLELPGPAPTIYRAAGTLKEWREDVAARCVGNRVLAFAVSCAFAGPLLTPLGEMGGGFHLFGQSRRGKSTALYAAASVWGNPRGHTPFARSWRATGNALEATAAEHNDALLALDEIGQVEPREAGEIAYMMSAGTGKIRAHREGRARPPLTWRVMLLSTGEKTLETVLAEAGQRAAAGQTVRLVDLAADAGAGMGAFEALHGSANPAAFAEALDAAMRRQHGTAGPAWLAWLQRKVHASPEWARDALHTRILDFLAEWCPPGSDGQVRTVARRFAVVGIAGELATEAGVTAWPEGEALRAAGVSLQAWLAARGGVGAREDMEAVQRLRAALAADGQARFELWRERGQVGGDEGFADEPPVEGRVVMKRLGWRRWQADPATPGAGRWKFYVTADGWREIMAGLEPGQAARAVARAGFLRLGRTGTTRTAKVPGYPSGVAVYECDGAILGGAAKPPEASAEPGG